MLYFHRKRIGLLAPRRVIPLSRSQGIFIHYSAGRHSTRVDDSARSIRKIQRYHLNKGWADIGYSWLVDDGGHVFEGRGWGRVGAHTGGYNTQSHGICYLGRDEPPTPAALHAIDRLITEHHERFGEGYVMGHRDVGRTACPGPHLTEWLRQGRPAPPPPPPSLLPQPLQAGAVEGRAESDVVELVAARSMEETS